MSIELYPLSLSDVHKGNFPLNHDCILKVDFVNFCPMSFCVFTCMSQHSGTIADIIRKLPLVSCVKISSVDNFKL